jgi:hypothetical protein
MTLKCGTCGAEVDPSGVFPGGTVKCRCGLDLVVVAAAPTAAQPPYRCAPVRHAPPAPAEQIQQAKWLCCTCLQPLSPTSREGHVLHGCASGHGLFVEHDVVEAMLRDASRAGAQSSSPQAFRPGEGVRYVRCPVCAEVMARKAFAPMSGIIVDICEHGTWFDAGELEQALAFAASRGDAGIDAIALKRGTPRPEAARALLEVSLAAEARREADSVRGTADVLGDLFDLFGLLTGMPSRHGPY